MTEHERQLAELREVISHACDDGLTAERRAKIESLLRANSALIPPYVAMMQLEA